MNPDRHAPTDHLEPLKGLTLHPEFVRFEDRSRVILQRFASTRRCRTTSEATRSLIPTEHCLRTGTALVRSG